MAKAIREIGLKLLAALNRLLAGGPRAGWKRSGRDPQDLLGK